MALFTRPRRVLALGVGLAALAVVTGVALQPRPVPVPTPPPPPSEAAATSFVDAVARSRRGTWAVTERTTRTFVGGRELLATTTRRVQRPPDSLVAGNGVILRTFAGRDTTCTAAPDRVDVLRCHSAVAVPAASVGATVTADLAALHALVGGATPLYTVAVDRAGCYVLAVRTMTALAPPYGRDATLCFDAGSGAPTRSTVVKDGAESSDDVIDQTIAAVVSGTVTDADFALPAGTVEDRPTGPITPGGPVPSVDPSTAAGDATSTTIRVSDNP